MMIIIRATAKFALTYEKLQSCVSQPRTSTKASMSVMLDHVPFYVSHLILYKSE
jgi:hypothetical protein